MWCGGFWPSITSPATPAGHHDPLFTYHRWQANLRVLGIDEVKTVPYTPLSHPFVERAVGSVRRELLDQVLFWNARDLSRKLSRYLVYYNETRGHLSIMCDLRSPTTNAPAVSAFAVSPCPCRALARYSSVICANPTGKTPSAELVELGIVGRNFIPQSRQTSLPANLHVTSRLPLT